MPVEIVMPRLSDTMTEGTIARWIKQPGDPVKRGEALAEIETDKALMQYEAFEDGTMGEIKVGEGKTVPLGEPIAILYKPGESAPAVGASNSDGRASGGDGASELDGTARAKAADAPGTAAAPQPAADAPAPSSRQPAPAAEAVSSPPQQAPIESHLAAPASAEQNGDRGRVRASPLARRLAAEHGLDVAQIQGTGPGGRIVRADVEEARARGGAAPAPAATGASPVAASAPALSGELKPFSRMQAVVARRMVESKTTIPHFQVTYAIDMTAAMRFRTESNAFLGKERGISVNDLFLKAVALTLRQHPVLNASYRDNGIQQNAEINVGNAVALPGGLVVPVIRNADQKSLPQVAAESRALAEKARTGGLALADYEGGTFTISNLGMFGVESFTAIVNPPQAGILAVGGVAEEPVVRDGQVVPGQICRVTLSADHRIVYGADAATFLRDLKALLEKPFGLVY